MILRWLIIIILIAFPSLSFAATYNAADCTYAEVAAKVAAADTGDIVAIPACEATAWASTLAITKAITLQGNGAGSTNLTSAVAGGGITYTPASPSASNRFRITALTFSYSGTGYAIRLINQNATKEYIRIDNSAITSTGNSYMIGISGTVFGSIDSNTLTSTTKMFDFSGNGSTQWDAFNATRAYGTEDNLYIEDNVITCANALDVSGAGGRYAVRYNTINNSSGSTYYGWDIHGNQGFSYTNLGTMLVEFYGNYIDVVNSGGYTVDHRGGWLLSFYNDYANVSTSISHYIREEIADDYKGSAYVMKPTNSYYWVNLKNNSTQIAYDSSYLSNNNCCVNTVSWAADTVYTAGKCYKFTNDDNTNCWFSNNEGGADVSVSPYHSGTEEPVWENYADKLDIIVDNDVHWVNMGQGTPIAENSDFFIQKTGTFDGTGVTGGGVGCGTAATMSAITTCTNGVGFWVPNATDDPTAASCSDLTGFVGTSPTYYGKGTLYKCSSNTWVAYYTPYTYPHPLRGEGGVTYYTLTVTAPTHGTITTPEGINCGSGGSICTMEYDSTTSAVLTFTADQEWRFSSASDDCAGTARGATCTLAMSAAKAAGATFVVQERVPWVK